MKFKFIYTLFGLAGFAFLFIGNRSGAPGDYTGSPFSQGGNTFCAECHTGGIFNSSTLISLLDAGTPVTEYEPGKLYRLKVSVATTNGTPAGYGFQTLVLGPTNLNAGAFGAVLPSGTRMNTQAGRRYFGHNMMRSSPDVEIDWTAPAAGTGNITIYAAGNAVNNNDNSTGDSPSRNILVVAEKVVSNVGSVENLAFETRLLENPVRENLSLFVKNGISRNLQIAFYDQQGRLVKIENHRTGEGNQVLQFPMTDFKKGLYFLRVGDGQQSRTLKMIKL